MSPIAPVGLGENDFLVGAFVGIAQFPNPRCCMWPVHVLEFGIGCENGKFAFALGKTVVHFVQKNSLEEVLDVLIALEGLFVKKPSANANRCADGHQKGKRIQENGGDEVPTEDFLTRHTPILTQCWRENV